MAPVAEGWTEPLAPTGELYGHPVQVVEFGADPPGRVTLLVEEVGDGAAHGVPETLADRL
ncbi:Uncharacterised protein [Mycobacteroides abscessus subsp. abscessus]|nr:Uncharacterised protein [Mycobacteroides abscessus subsp. abscessus]